MPTILRKISNWKYEERWKFPNQAIVKVSEKCAILFPLVFVSWYIFFLNFGDILKALG